MHYTCRVLIAVVVWVMRIAVLLLRAMIMMTVVVVIMTMVMLSVTEKDVALGIAPIPLRYVSSRCQAKRAVQKSSDPNQHRKQCSCCLSPWQGIT